MFLWQTVMLGPRMRFFVLLLWASYLSSSYDYQQRGGWGDDLLRPVPLAAYLGELVRGVLTVVLIVWVLAIVVLINGFRRAAPRARVPLILGGLIGFWLMSVFDSATADDMSWMLPIGTVAGAAALGEAINTWFEPLRDKRNDK